MADATNLRIVEAYNALIQQWARFLLLVIDEADWAQCTDVYIVMFSANAMLNGVADTITEHIAANDDDMPTTVAIDARDFLESIGDQIRNARDN